MSTTRPGWWLEETANARTHATTGEAPRERYARAEQPHMAPYLRPPGVAELTGEAPLTRHADKTGLIAWQANKYSVPLAYQRSRVGVVESDGQRVISDPGSGAVIARHGLAPGKGAIIKNTHHYRDPAVAIADLEAAIAQRLGAASGQRLCALIKATEPKIYQDQLQGVKRLLEGYPALDPGLVAALCDKPAMSYTRLRAYLDAYRAHPERCGESPPRTPSGTGTSASSPLARYAAVAAQNAPEGAHDRH